LIDIDGRTDAAYSMALQSDGKIIVVGGSEALPPGVGFFEPLESAFIVARLDADGAIDPTFADDGIFRYANPLAPPYFSAATTVAVLSDDSIVFGGTSGGSSFSERSGAVFRLTSDGKLDSHFFGTGARPFDRPV